MTGLKPLLVTMVVAIAAGVGTAGHAQRVTKPPASDTHPRTDVEKITDALRGGPPFVTEHATILDFPSSPTGEVRVLRQGSGQWTCLPGDPTAAHDEPGCFDPVYLQFARDGLAKRPSTITKIGISYMYQGKWLPNRSGRLTKDREYHVGPHIMIAVPHDQQASIEAISRDGSDGQPYTNQSAPGMDRYLVIPVTHWPKQ